MARKKLSDELKQAISMLPSKEKDKLLFRLLPKDAILVEQLEFKLLDHGQSTEELRAERKQDVANYLQRAKYSFYSPGYLLLDLRSISAAITKHVKVTKDKYGEIELNFFMLNECFELMAPQLKQFSYSKKRTFSDYVVKRSLKLLKLLSKLHEDYQLDFQESMRQLGFHLQNDPDCYKAASVHELEVRWLLEAEIPEEF